MTLFISLLVCGFAPVDQFPVFVLGGTVLLLLLIAGLIEYFSKEKIDDIDGED